MALGEQGGSSSTGAVVEPEKEKPTPASLSDSDDQSKKISIPENAQDELAHLPQNEREIIERQIHMPNVPVTYFQLYRFATVNDLILIAIGCVTAIIGGAILPVMTVLFGQLAQTFQNFALEHITRGHMQHEINRFTLYFLYLGIGEFVMVYISTVLLIYTGEHITGKIREEYLRAILRQNIAFFDKLGAGEITTRITADTNLIQEGISEKVGLSLSAAATFFAAFVISFVKNWKLTLILCSTVLAITLLMGLCSGFIVKFQKQSLNSYAEGGTVAEEVISSIRNTQAFNTQDKLARAYDAFLVVAEKWGFKQRAMVSFMMGIMMCIVYLNYGLAFWQGSRFLVQGKANLSQVLTVMMAIMIGAFSLGHVAPNIQAFTTGVSAAAKIYNTIDRVSPLNPDSPEGDKLETVEGTIELRGVKHIYPSRPTVEVLHNMNLVIPAGKVTALVGASGSGKSTIVGLVERFYDPVAGQVFLDGHDISTLNLRWLREHIALVSQEPVLFGTTIFGNVCHGLIGTRYENASEEVKRDLVVKACQMSNADGFIRSLPEGYETNVGERGFLLSGGQKQRIAIARSIVSDPKILLLDEATSALDTKSEGVVQAALDAASQGRTTIVIAHRLSTIKTADNIVVMAAGNIIEQGTHDQLIEKQGAYYQLVEAQRISASKEAAAGEEGSADAEPEVDEDEELKLKVTRSHASGREVPIADPDDENLGEKLNRTTTTKSKSSVALANKPKEEEKKYSLWSLIKMTASFNKQEMPYMLLGLFASIICGGGYPTQAVLFAKSINALSRPPNEYGLLRKDANFWSGMYLMLAVVQFLAHLVQGVSFAYCAEKLVHRVRDQAFRTMLRQDIGFFDKEENTTGSLTSFLSTETTHLAGMSGVTLGTLLTVSTTLVSAMALGVAVGWKLALVCIAAIPILLACGFFRFWMLAQFQRRSKAAYEKSGGYACEATAAIRTVASLARERDVWDSYHEQIAVQEKKSLNSVIKSSMLYAASQSLMFLCMALGFWYGGSLIRSGEYNMTQFFMVFTAIIFGAQSAGIMFSFSSDMGKAKSAAIDLKALFDRKPEIDAWSEEGESVPEVEGSIEFRDVHFRYPTRPEQPVLRGLNLTVKPGQYVALVGPSGCGKSTTISLIERFYNPLVGGVFVDGQEISTLKLNEYRSHIALVSQEPTLYQGTIKENVLLGGDRDDVSDEEIEKACRAANIYDFIMSLPEGFNTVCGSKGTLLSGGQKQRIAIARALIRNPKILLLDEATSALDSESEKVVQAALDAAAEGRTTVAVAHRLSTIQKADLIYVFDSGKVVESGTHFELLAKKGKYYELVQLQSLEKSS
ncbi:P-loop containing nucleoside triphosphate hydrolase protein [Sphaerosporella brunnea]|uniref:P-loop containing nucleoside triphosphate hydrolase protein n=1 Tax=Sphaerosporella brunnea TaxID=1250544 RepID=A0A5J5F418_9PEZI|nr:P-loop containing nucleoside triphosphate hydrolase protein [Sphaerosporella brunnea]